jgi:hypothetical protein
MALHVTSSLNWIEIHYMELNSNDFESNWIELKINWNKIKLIWIQIKFKRNVTQIDIEDIEIFLVAMVWGGEGVENIFIWKTHLSIILCLE